jgi:hypothetical protein
MIHEIGLVQRHVRHSTAENPLNTKPLLAAGKAGLLNYIPRILAFAQFGG